jgi:hypothetical protein
MPSTVSPPATMGEALAQLDAALRFLDEAGFAQLPPEEQGQVLLAFDEPEPLTAATRALILGVAAAPAGGRHRVPTPPVPPRR